eukprot:CAMPEP_0202485620 /NCGR_PEP_ID=MMETSP1361-20130828/4422_1 /ASSEMBLY_ACC=CAM_ASM_000849 /TAXON_ID=210615 /ORGANISM="Staurosira complex sp., Strain CCMP2646" /LENGTH=623 /DNA_ID=CAMNT_0049114575 /DNA_START=148 /DNA_END=2020 /DNA_ORIENTATION=+
MQRRDDGGLGNHLVGDRIHVNHKCVQVTKLLGEGGFSYVYLVKDISEGATALTQSTASDSGGAHTVKTLSNTSNGSSSSKTNQSNNMNTTLMVLKVTSIHSRQQRDIAEKEAKLLSRLSHPSIIKMYDSCYRTTSPVHSVGMVASIVGANKEKSADSTLSSNKERPQHLILMEYCEGGHALDVCTKLANAGHRFDLSALIIAFGQICNAVSYLHAQRPPIVHRDLKPVNFLVKNGAYKLCDFGSAVFGHVELKTPRARMEAEEVIQKTTTQMFRAPEMVDLYMAKKLTQSTDVWALGCCLYSLAFLQNCFEEGSNLAIISNNYKIPEDNPYGPGLVELIDRMLTVDCKARADMTEVILCLSAIYSGRPLPPRKKISKTKKSDGEGTDSNGENDKPRGTYRTDGQGIRTKVKPEISRKPAEAKKLNPNSAAARRRRAANSPREGRDATGGAMPPIVSSGQVEFNSAFPEAFSTNDAEGNVELAFSTADNPFAGLKDDRLNERGGGAFRSFDSGGGGSSSDGGFISFDDSWTKPRPDNVTDAAFPKHISPQRDSTSSRASRSSSRDNKSTISGNVSMDGLSLSQSGDSVLEDEEAGDVDHQRQLLSSKIDREHHLAIVADLEGPV